MYPRFDIAIVGGGAAGTLAAIQLLRQATGPLRIAMFEPAPQPGRGVAYATTRAEHLLNVPAARMSALPDRPDDFLQWYAAQPEQAAHAPGSLAARFAARRDYARYLAARLQQARDASPASLAVLPWRITALDRDTAGGHWRLHAQDGAAGAARVLLAVGNAPRPLPVRGAGALPRPARIDAWDYQAVAAIDPAARVCIAGTGLSMVDVLLTLAGNGHRGPVHLLSRHGLLPLAHAEGHALDDAFAVEPLHALGPRQRLAQVRRAVRDAAMRGLPWQAVMERLRPHGQALWRSLTPAGQRRFLRHGARYWDIHRHRIAPEAGALLQAWLAAGRLQVHRARLELAVAGQRCVQLTARAGGGQRLVFEVDHVVNATGLELRVQAMGNPLLEQLLGEGHARPGAHGIGLDSDTDGRLLDAAGHARDDLRVMGSLRIGEAWETIAVPELRLQAAAVAAAWTGPPGSGAASR